MMRKNMIFYSNVILVWIQSLSLVSHGIDTVTVYIQFRYQPFQSFRKVKAFIM